MAEGLAQKRREGLARHLADAHGEFTMSDASEPADMPIDRHIVRWIGEEKGGTLALQHAIEGLTVAGISTKEMVTIKDPQVVPSGHCGAWIAKRGHLIFRRIVRLGRRFPCFIEH